MVLYLAFGSFGYLYACAGTCVNILLNFGKDDGLAVAGSGSLGGVLMLNFPLICQPCRNAFFRLLSSLEILAPFLIAEPAPETETAEVTSTAVASPQVHVYL